MEKRKREGKENELFVDGFRVPTKRIKKEMSRHRWPNQTGIIYYLTPILRENLVLTSPQLQASKCELQRESLFAHPRLMLFLILTSLWRTSLGSSSSTILSHEVITQPLSPLTDSLDAEIQ